MEASRALRYVLIVVFVLIVGDCVSTYLCLTTPVPESLGDYRVTEANPLSLWMFKVMGLVGGLIAFVALKVVGLGILDVWARADDHFAKMFLVLMIGAALLTLYVNYNNWSIYFTLLNG